MEIIGLLGLICLGLANLPELYKAMTNKSCSLTWGYLMLVFFGLLLFAIYSSHINNTILFINYFFNLIIIFVLILFKFNGKK